jgi:hypothetical protein
MNCRATYIAMNFLTTSATNTFSITTLLHGLSAYILVCHLVIAFALHFLPLLSLPFSLLIIFAFIFEVSSSLQCHPPYCSPAADFLAISVKNFVCFGVPDKSPVRMRFMVGWKLCNGLPLIAISLHFTHPIYKTLYNVPNTCSFHILTWKHFFRLKCIWIYWTRLERIYLTRL